MKIFYQTQSNDCGVAVTQSLIYHFYKVKIPYTEIFRKAKINQNGINLADLENLNDWFGIKIESYACDFQEFLKLPDQHYYIIMKKNEECFHYCIVYKMQNKNIIYDPGDKSRILDNVKMSQIFSNVVLTVEKKWKKFQSQNKAIKSLSDEKQLLKLLMKSNLKEIIFSIFISLITIFLTIANSQAFKFILSNVIAENQLQNLSTIYLFFILTLLLETFLLFTTKFVQEKITWKIYENLNVTLKKKLENSVYFFSKIDENILLQMPNCLYGIAKYVTYTATDLIDEGIFITILIFLLPKISIYFLITFGIIVILNLIFNVIFYFQGQSSKWKVQKITDTQINVWQKFIRYLQTENDYQKKRYIHSLWIKNFENQNIFYQKMNFFNNKVGSLKKFVQSAFNLINLVIGSVLIIKFNKIKLEDLISGIFIIGFFLNYCGSISRSMFSFNLYRLQAIRYLNCISINEKNKSGNTKWPEKLLKLDLNNLVWNEPKITHWKTHHYKIENDTIIFGQNGIGKTTLCQTFVGKINLFSGKIQLNNEDIYQYENFSDNIILLNAKSTLEEDIYVTTLKNIFKLTKENVKNILQFLITNNLDKQTNLNSLSSGERQILNWLYLLTFENKIIICDEALSFVQHQQKIKLLEITKPIITEKNFLVVIEHDETLKTLFKNELQLHQI